MMPTLGGPGDACGGMQPCQSGLTCIKGICCMDSSCGGPCQTGACSANGSGCQPRPAGTSCGATTCSDGNTVEDRTCDGHGGCGASFTDCAAGQVCLLGKCRLGSGTGGAGGGMGGAGGGMGGAGGGGAGGGGMGGAGGSGGGGGPGSACGGPAGPCASGLACMGGRCCMGGCGGECRLPACDASGACLNAPNGTPCRGKSGMTCQSGTCTG
jgi:hypothetical protein